MAQKTERQIPALALAEAREQLEAQIDEAVRAFEQTHQGTLNLTVDCRKSRDEVEGRTEAERALAASLCDLVELFSHRGIVQETGVYVHSITVIDSDGDGEAAVSVKYEYADDAG